MSRHVQTAPLSALELAALIKAINRGSPLPLASERRAVERGLQKLEAGVPFVPIQDGPGRREHGLRADLLDEPTT